MRKMMIFLLSIFGFLFSGCYQGSSTHDALVNDEVNVVYAKIIVDGKDVVSLYDESGNPVGSAEDIQLAQLFIEHKNITNESLFWIEIPSMEVVESKEGHTHYYQFDSSVFYPPHDHYFPSEHASYYCTRELVKYRCVFCGHATSRITHSCL